ncbi:MAG: adenosylcobinamide-GDP ribazoletransferase [Paracoccaceae bacterium]|nr:adenosylcobinamide-GDP ribazoletransferase [Paracoccaceae bacterium]
MHSSRLKPADLFEAVGLLSRIPVRGAGDRGARAAWAWPLAGALVAILASLVGWLSLWLGVPAASAAGLALAVQVIATGAMHEDGLADCADGFWGGWHQQQRLEIMKDSRIGTYGVVALLLGLGLRWSLMAALFSGGWVLAPLMVAGVLSRAPMAMLMNMLPPARDDGLSKNVGRPDGDIVLAGWSVALIVALLYAGFAAITIALACVGAALGMAALAQNRVGGQTGDILGACQQLCEIATLAVFAAIFL